MTKYSKYNLVYRLQKWMDSVPGQTFLNYAYSWGASIVILGTLFKLTHLPAANIMLFIGMGTEVLVFFISAFDRPFDKTEVGKELPTHAYQQDSELSDDERNNVEMMGTKSSVEGQSIGGQSDQSIIFGGKMQSSAESEDVNVQSVVTTSNGSNIGGGTVVIGGGFAGRTSVSSENQETLEQINEGQESVSSSPISTDQLAAAVNQAAWVQQQQQVSPEMEEATNNYVDELKKLTEMLSKVSEQSERLTRDSEEMENLNRTLTGICKIYEIQLKGASAQVGTIDQINEQSRKMANQIEQLNKIYARMIEAMTVNMKVATPTANLDNND
jgi:gliding motility-associated protein GldL